MAGVFSGVRVIELAQFVYVPGAGAMMADQGAEVIKIETIEGDPYRTLKLAGASRNVGSVNISMEQNNRSKKSIALDLKSEEGREALLKLIETADVFLTSLRPKAIRGLRLDVDDVRARNPQIIYARGNGLGFKGAEADKPGFDASSFWARGGVCHAFTRPGTQPPSPRAAFGDHSGSMALAFGIASALFKRAATGEASVVETSLLATAAWMLSADVTYSQAPGYKIHHEGGAGQPLMHAYATRDGRLIQLMLLDPRPHWVPLCQMLDLPELADDPRFAEHETRLKNAAALIDLIQERIGSEDWAYWEPLFNAFQAPWELIRTILDVSTDPQVLANDMVFNMSVGEESIRVVASPAAFDGKTTSGAAQQSPDMGQHTVHYLSEIGYTLEQIESLKQRQIAQ